MQKFAERNKEIKDLYRRNLTMQEIANLFGLTRQRVHQIISGKRTKIIPGEKSSFKVKNFETDKILKSGESLYEKFPYLREFTGRGLTRELVRIRDNFTCQKCGKIWAEGERRFDVHHIDCDSSKTKGYDSRKEMKNMVTLCHKCHLNLPEHREKCQNSAFDPQELSTDDS